MTNENRPKSETPERIPLRLEFHYEVDDRGDNYRVWEEQFREPVAIGSDKARLPRPMSL